MRRAVASFAFAVLVLASTAARAQSVAVLPPSGVNIAPGLLEAAQDILRGHLAQTGRFHEVHAVRGPVGATELDGAEAAAQARAAGADIAAVLNVTRLGSSATIRLSAYLARDGQLAFTDRMQAASPDDMERVLGRLAKGMAERKPSGETAELGTVTEAETTSPLRRPATHVFGLGLGVDIPTDGGDAVPGLSVFWLYDAKSFLADIALGLHTGDHGGDFSLGIGAYYPFGLSDFTPYLGGGARYAATSFDGMQGHGIQLYAALGALTGRLGSVQFRGQLEYFVNTFSSTKTEYEDSYTYGSSLSTTYTPRTTSNVGQGFGLSIGLGF